MSVTPATRTDATNALTTLAAQTGPGAAPLGAILAQLLFEGDQAVAAGGTTPKYTQLVCAVDRYLLALT
jgi:hypothetical protein